MTPDMAVSLSAEAMIDILEQGTGRHPIDQALLLLRRVCPDQSLGALCDWTVGERDMRLLEIRRATFGDRING